jgi:hypothetical protein
VSGWPAGLRFRPIQQWPGDLTRSRRRSPFEASLSATQDLLGRELKALQAKTVVIQLAIGETDLRLDGLPRAQARPEHPGVILSLESPYGPLSYPCDTFTDWQSNLRAVALALEALRKVDRYGVTKNGEQYRGWRQLSASADVFTSKGDAAYFIARAARPEQPDEDLRQWYWRLISEPKTLAKTYRLAAHKLHPDTGGQSDDFLRLQQAKAILNGGGS